MKAKSGNLAFIDTIRGIAIILVFLFHCLLPAFGFYELEWNGWVRSFDAPLSLLVLSPLTLGKLGVAVFFVVSGFCIQLSWDRRADITTRTFLIRRFFRIYPPYLLALVVAYFVWKQRIVSFGDDGQQLASHLLLVHNFDREWFFGICASFWSIAVEFQLYLLYPLLRNSRE